MLTEAEIRSDENHSLNHLKESFYNKVVNARSALTKYYGMSSMWVNFIKTRPFKYSGAIVIYCMDINKKYK